MSTGLRELHREDLDDALEQLLAPRLADVVRHRDRGHCMRISDLDTSVAVRVALRLRRVTADAHVHVLADATQVPVEIAVSSTKLVELRNPGPDGNQRPPLLVFIPPGSHASAEDSFGVATFEELELGDVYAALTQRLLEELPSGLRSSVEDLFAVLDEAQWPPADAMAKARYLLTLKHNEQDAEAAGAAVFELGLVPDFGLFTDAAAVRTRTGRNLQHVRTLADADRPERQRVLRLGLTDPAFRARLAEFVAEVGLEDPRGWTRKIVVDRANWPLAFQRWPLRDDASPEEIRLTVGELDLPVAGDRPADADNPVLQELIGQQYLPVGAQGISQLPVLFQVGSDPRQIAGLRRFSVQLVSEDGGPTGLVASVRVSTTAKTEYKATLKKLRQADLEAGWHFVRVDPLDDEGVALPVERSDTANPLNESTRFYVLPDGSVEEPPDSQRAIKEAGLTQALRRLQFAALAEERAWTAVQYQSIRWKATKGAGKHTLAASFGADGRVEIPLTPALADLEHRILAEPAELSSWRLPITADGPEAPVRGDIRWPADLDAEAADRFATARLALFHRITDSDGEVIEGSDLLGLRQEVCDYAESYGELLSWMLLRAEQADDDNAGRALRDLGVLLRLDSVSVDFTGIRGGRQEVTLVAPTHPMRLLWLVTWASLGHSWLKAAEGTAETAVLAAKDTLLAGLSSVGFPLAVPRPGGRLASAAHDLTPYWGVCVAAETDDPQELISTLSSALRMPDRRVSGTAISGARLAERIERYLRLHPYVNTLVIAAVNAGRGDHLADMLVELQRRPEFRHLNYDLRLFVANPETSSAGESLAELLRGEWTTAAHAEAFRTPAASGLTPKLAVAVRPLDEFRSASNEQPAHVAVLFDAFSGEKLDTAPATETAVAPVHGLLQSMSVTYVEDEDVVAWHKAPRHGRALPLEGAEELTDLVASLPATISQALTTVATGQTGTHRVPQITLTLDVEDRTLLHQAHHTSDWVVTVDRTLGVEYFDTPGSTQRPEYVIDYAPDHAEGLGHHIVISSRSVEELRSLLDPVIKETGLEVDARHVGTFFDQLRLLSGRLAFKLASVAPTERMEVLGLALARLYLDYQGALTNQILVPLDAHLELYREARKRADEIGEKTGLQRTDLALFDLDARRKTITCRLVEVKCSSGMRDLSAYQQRKDQIAEQFGRSETVLGEHFDAHRAQPDRPDRTVKNAELAALLRHYLDRAVRHGVMRPDAEAEARWLLDRLDLGYHLAFTRTGLIFDLAGKGIEIETEGGIEFHRIGRKLAEDLIDAIPTDPVVAPPDREPTPELPAPTVARPDATVPRLARAAFRTPDRDRQPPTEDSDPFAAIDDQEPTASLPQAEEPEAAAETEPSAELPQTIPESEPPEAPRTKPASAMDSSVAAAAEPDTEPIAVSAVTPDAFVGTTRPSPQYGILGEVAGRRVALDLNETHTISLFGVQGGGKSYTLGTIMEMACLSAPPINQLSRPLATIVFHYSQTQDYAPEFTSMVAANDDDAQVRLLRERYGAEPQALSDVAMLVPEDQLAERRAEYPSVQVHPLKFGSGELRAEHWRFLMAAVGNQSTYIRQLQRIMRANRNNLNLEVIRHGIETSGLPDHLKQLAEQRLALASDYIDDEVRIKDLIQPGRMIIVDLRDEFIEKDEALGLFVVLMQLFAEAQDEGTRFNKLVVFDEAHKYIESPDLVAGLVESVREMRHKGMSVLVASQDPPSVPISLIELSNHIILHKFTSPAWLKHLQKANASLAALTAAKMAALTPGEAYLWSSRATDAAFTREAIKIRCRPRLTRHGGGTRTAVDE